MSFGSDMSRVFYQPVELEYLFLPCTRWRVVGHADAVGFSYSGPSMGAVASMKRPVVFLVDENDLPGFAVDPSASAKGW